MTESFILASIGSPYGINGFVKIKSFSGETGHLASLKNVILRKNGHDRLFIVEEIVLSQDSDTLLIKFNAIDNPEDAKTLAGSVLVAERTLAAPLNDGEFYIEDLKGLRIISADEHKTEVLGHITDIVDGGGGELAEILLVSGIKKFIPFRKEFFGQIDITKQTAILLEKWILDL